MEIHRKDRAGTAWQREYISEWVGETEQEKHLRELAQMYHVSCDVYDAHVCSNISPRSGEPIPANPYEYGLVNGHARKVRQAVIDQGEQLGLTARQIEDAIRKYAK